MAASHWYRELKSHPLSWKLGLLVLALLICLLIAVRSASEQQTTQQRDTAISRDARSATDITSSKPAASRTVKPTGSLVGGDSAAAGQIAASSLAPRSSPLDPSLASPLSSQLPSDTLNRSSSTGGASGTQTSLQSPAPSLQPLAPGPQPPVSPRVTIHKSDARPVDDEIPNPAEEVRPEDVLRALDRIGSANKDGGGNSDSASKWAQKYSSSSLSSTSLFGLAAEGRRFVYVFDRSASMSEPDQKPIRSAKAELIRSIERLDSLHQFFLVFYNQEPKVFNPSGVGGRQVFATDESKKAAERFIQEIRPEGATNHYEALLIAARLRPDVIFLLTDGEEKDDLSADELSHLKRLNDGVAQIHVIQFASSPHARNSLAELARGNRGEHLYLDVRKLNATAKTQP